MGNDKSSGGVLGKIPPAALLGLVLPARLGYNGVAWGGAQTARIQQVTGALTVRDDPVFQNRPITVGKPGSWPIPGRPDINDPGY